MYQLEKKFRFEAAHRLAKGYEGKCKNIHGHSWNGTIVIECGVLDKYDFGMDFSLLKDFTKKIEANLDHSILLIHTDTELIDLCEKNKWLYQSFISNPTCETISKWIYELAKLKFAEYPIKVHSVIIEETCTSKCIYHE